MRSGPYHATVAAHCSPTHRVVMLLTVLGLIASFGTICSLTQAYKAQVGENPFYYGDIVKGPIYYALHAVEILLLLSAGLLALWLTNPRDISGGFLWRFGLLLAAGLFMAARGYTLQDLFSTRLVDGTGPFSCLISVIIFVGVRRSNWLAIDKMLLATATVLSLVVLWAITDLRTTARPEAVTSMVLYGNALYWPASWTALRPYPQGSAGRYVRFAPAATYGIASLFMQTRLNFIMIFALLGMCAYVDRRRGARQAPRWVAALGITAWLALFAMVFLPDTRVFKKVEGAAEGFYSRLDEDTRTGQLKAFFWSVQPHELLLGRGSFAKWWWGRSEWNGGTDVGYLSLLFFGGVPLLVTYFAVHMAPAFVVLKRRPIGAQLAPAAIVVLWTIRMFSSSYPSLMLEYYPILFCVGACISREL